MFKNTSGQRITVYAENAATGLPVTGDAANIAAYVSKDDATVTVLGDTSATEQSSTLAKGYYIFDLAQAETNGDKLLFSAKSTTANVVVRATPDVVYTTGPVVVAAGGMGVSAFSPSLLQLLTHCIVISGSSSPAVEDLYQPAGITPGGLLYYKSATLSPPMFIWSEGPDWVISSAVNVFDTGWFTSATDQIDSGFGPNGTATGNPGVGVSGGEVLSQFQPYARVLGKLETTLELGFGGNYRFTTPALVNAPTTIGTGAFAVTVNVKDNGTSANIVGATLRVTGAQAAGPVTTDSSGNAVVRLNAGAVTVAVTATGYIGTGGPQTIAGVQTINIRLVAAPTPPSPPSGSVFIEGYVVNAGLVPMGNATVYYRQVANSTLGVVVSGQILKGITDSSGFFQLLAAPAGEYEIWFGKGSRVNYITTSAAHQTCPPILGEEKPA